MAIVFEANYEAKCKHCANFRLLSVNGKKQRVSYCARNGDEDLQVNKPESKRFDRKKQLFSREQIFEVKTMDLEMMRNLFDRYADISRNPNVWMGIIWDFYLLSIK